jgi:AcrR family transcriptional regulator
MSAKTTARTSARERLLAAADELFYDEGVHSVGIDRVIERAGVAKASLYNTFGSKDDLVLSYLDARHAVRASRFDRHIAKWDTPRERVLAIFDALEEAVAEPTFRGCAFINASAESGGQRITERIAESRSYLRKLFGDLVEATGVPDHKDLASRLSLLYDGAIVTAQMDRDPSAAKNAHAAAEVLLDAAGV